MPGGSIEKKCWARKHQDAWILTPIVLSVLYLLPHSKQASTFMNTSDIKRTLERKARK